MDYKKIKQSIIDRYYDGPNKSCDIYRSFVVQIDHIIGYLQKKCSPLQWLPLYIMTDEEIIRFIYSFMQRDKNKSRMLFSSLSYEGIKYDYSDLIVTVEEHEKDRQMILEVVPDLATFTKLKIREEIPDIKKKTRTCKPGEYKKLVAWLSNLSDNIRHEIIDEKNLIKCMGIAFTYPDYLEQYIDVVEVMATETIFACILLNNSIRDKKSVLIAVETNMDRLIDVIEKEYITKSKKYLDMRRNELNLDRNYIDMITIYFWQYMQRQAIYDERCKIRKFLEKEIISNKELFGPPILTDISAVEECTPEKLQDILTEGRKVPTYAVKVSEAMKLLELAGRNGDLWYSSNSINDLKPIFREVYMSKVSYIHNNAMTIARNLLAEMPISKQHMMFFDMKIVRGYFREMGMLEEYLVYNRICEKLQATLLKTYCTLDDREALNAINRICYDFLYKFYFNYYY